VTFKSAANCMRQFIDICNSNMQVFAIDSSLTFNFECKCQIYQIWTTTKGSW